MKTGREVKRLLGKQEGETFPTRTLTDDNPRDGQSSQIWIYFEG